MPSLKLDNFSGLSPRTGPTNLAPNQAQVANNVKLQSGEIRPWRKPLATYTPGLSDPKTIYKLENTTLATEAWLEWSTDVDVVPGPVADITDFRVYYTDGVIPKKTNWALATTSGTGTKPFPDTYYNLGVPAPAAAPTLVKTGGSGTVHEDRAYVYTYISTFGAVLEESAPSPAAQISTVEPNATVTVSAFSTAPIASAGYNITAIRIYRSVVSATSAVYLYVGTVAVNPSTGVAAGSFADNVLSANLGVVLPSLAYSTPPDKLQGLIAMPNGILAGFTDNQVWFCEPYLPHAWPVAYMMTVGAPIVGLGVFGQTLVVCTTQTPYLITGSQPGAMSQEKVPLPEPCISKKSITSDQSGVLYASPNGLVSIAPGQADVITRQLFTRDEWQLYASSLFVGVIYQNMYLGFYQSGSTKAALVIMRGDSPPLINLSVAAQAVFVARSTATVYYIDPNDGLLYTLDGDTVNNMFYQWQSKKFILPEPTNFAVMKAQVDWDAINSVAAYNAVVAEIIAANQAYWATGATRFSTLNRTPLNTLRLNGSVLEPIPTLQDVRNVQILLFANGVQVYSTGVTSQEPIRLPAGAKEYLWEIKITGNVGLRTFAMANAVGELRNT